MHDIIGLCTNTQELHPKVIKGECRLAAMGTPRSIPGLLPKAIIDAAFVKERVEIATMMRIKKPARS